jgi:glycosyltransferase involved in cell wall biosynthesis
MTSARNTHTPRLALRSTPQFSLVARKPPARRLRIALFSGNYNCVPDGANQALNRLVYYLIAEAEAEVRVYSPTIANPPFAPAGTLVSVPSISLPRRPEYRLALGLPRSIREDLRRFAPDIVHLSAPDLLGRNAQRMARTHGIPVVTSLHTRFETYVDYYGLGFLKRGMERYLHRFYDNSDRILVPNAAIADEMRDAGLGDRVDIWGRGVDRSIFTPTRRDETLRRRLGYADGEIAILFFGRLVREKGIDRFTQVIEKLRAAGHNLRPMIVGAGPARDAFAQQLPNANFLGHLSGAALGRAVASADILLNPSLTEAFGNVTLEAMAAGLAIVSADVPSASALIADGRTGRLVDPDNLDAYVAAIDRLIRFPALRAQLGSAAAVEARHYSWNETLAPVLATYRRCLKLPD